MTVSPDLGRGDASIIAPTGTPVAVQASLLDDLPDEVERGLGDGVAIQAVFELHADHDTFGGLSGLWLADDGSRMIAVSDVGQRWHARLRHDSAGLLTGIEDWSVADLPLAPDDGEGTPWIDAEALASDGAGGLMVAFEGAHRLHRWPLDNLQMLPERLPPPDGLGAPSNSGIEALSMLGDGRLLALAEGVGAWGGEGLMGWIIDIDERTADDLVYIPAPGFSPTGAARLDDRIYVVERRFSLLGGFQSRVVSLPADAVTPGARLSGQELAAFRFGDVGENFEGIAARQGADGRIHLYLLADDNFSFFQQTLLVQLSLSPETQTH